MSNAARPPQGAQPSVVTARPSAMVTRVSMRRWGVVMLVLGLTLGVLVGRWTVGGFSSLMPDSSVTAPGEYEGASGETYGTGLPAPGQSGLGGTLSPEASRIVSRLIDLGDQVESLPTLAAMPAVGAPKKADASGLLSGSFWQSLTELFQVRRVDDGAEFLKSVAFFELGRDQLRFRLLAARLSIQLGQNAAAQGDLLAAQALLARLFDQTAEPVRRASGELNGIYEAVSKLP